MSDLPPMPPEPGPFTAAPQQPPPQPGYPPQPGWNAVGYGYTAGGAPLKPLGVLSTGLSVLVGIAALLAAALAAALLSRASLIDDPSASFSDFVSADDRVAGTAGPYLLAFVVGGITWMVWQFRYAKNVTALGRPLQGGAARAIWGWFIPIANYFIAPYQLLRAARETDRARGGSGAPPATLVPWWITFGVGTFLWAVSTNIRPSENEPFASIDDFRTADQLGAVGSALIAVSGLLAILTIRACTSRQMGEPSAAAPPTTF